MINDIMRRTKAVLGICRWDIKMVGGRFRKLLLKNTLAYVFPTLILLFVLITIVLEFPVTEKIHNVNIEKTDMLSEELQDLYDSDKTNVVYEANNLYYTGIDYKEDGEQKGAYYYNIDENGVNFYLIRTKSPTQLLESKRIKAQIVKNEIMVDYILNQFADNSDITPDMLEGFASNYILSEVDYPHEFIALIYVVIFLPIIAGILVIMYTILIGLVPSLHPQAKQLEEYGTVGKVIRELDYEMKYNLLYRKNNIYITDNYMIVSYLTKTDVIKLDLVKYMSKNIVEPDRGLYRGKEIYRLTFSNPEKLFYEVDFSNEELVDTVIEHILPG